MPGQQLVQMPDGKLHVLNTTQAIATASPQQQAVVAATTPSTGAATSTAQAGTKASANAVASGKTSAGSASKATPVKVTINQTDATQQQQTPVQLQQVVQSGQRLKAAIVSPGTVSTPKPRKGKFVVANTGQVVQGAQVSCHSLTIDLTFALCFPIRRLTKLFWSRLSLKV
jgi:nucleosome-remodeling factor subunit BPTF